MEAKKDVPSAFATAFEKIALAAQHRNPCPECGVKKVVVDVPGIGQRTVVATCEHQDAAWKALKDLEERESTYQTRMTMYGKVLPPRAYATLRLADVIETPGNRAGLSAARQYVAKLGDRLAAGDGLLFSGPPGTRKTLIACALGNEFEARHLLPVVVTVPDLLDKLRDRNTPPEFGTMLRKVDLLVLDELGAEKITEFASAELFGIVDSRYRERKPVVATTNLGLGDVRAKWIRSLEREGLGPGPSALAIDRILDRLQERCTPVLFSGESGRAAARPNWLVTEGGAA